MRASQSHWSQDFVAVSYEARVRDVTETIQKKKSELGEKFSYVYAVNGENQLVGVLPLRELLLANPETSVCQLMNTTPIVLRNTSTQDEIATLANQYPFLVFPVVDEEGKLVGVLRRPAAKPRPIDSSHSLFQTFNKMGGRQEEIEGQSILKIISRRLPWLLLSIITGLMCAYILGIFVEEIESMVALVLFIPIVLGVAGGVGVQSSVITIRGLSKGSVSLSELGRVLAKEIAIGFWIGLLSFAIVTVIALVWQKSLVLGFALGLSMIACVVVSGIVGIFLPLILRTLRLSPVLASGFFVLIICDILVMVVYFTLASLLINPTV